MLAQDLYLPHNMKSKAWPNSQSVHLLDSCRAVIALFRGLLLGLFFFAVSTSQAAPNDLHNYKVRLGGFTNIKDGAYVEGSVGNGGTQPDYYIDLQSEPLKSLIEQARAIGQENLDFWDKVGLIVELVGQDFFKYNNYYNPYYRRLLKQYRDAHKDVPLSEYGVCSAGVCREHALVLHFALKAAGIKNKHAYAEIYRASNYEGYEINEDHAFTVVKYQGTKWVVDAYYQGFNGYRLEDLLSAEGITEHSPMAPIAIAKWGTRRIVKINDFPIVYNPKNKVPLCSSIF